MLSCSNIIKAKYKLSTIFHKVIKNTLNIVSNKTRHKNLVFVKTKLIIDVDAVSVSENFLVKEKIIH